MSEDRLERALQAIKEERIDEEQLADAGARVWDKLGNPGTALCSEFRAQMRMYLDGGLSANRRLLMEDHLGRCPACRAQLAREKGESNIISMPKRRFAWPAWGTWAAAAAILMMAVYIGRNTIDDLLAPGGARATVASVQGGLYLLPEGALKPGEAIGENQVIRTGPGARAVLRLRDGSTVDVNERTELSLHAAWSGQSVRLQNGDVIVHAAKQRRGHLRVETRDSVASVRGTIFAVSTGFSGSVVSVVEGSVAVTQPGTEVVLSPGQQAASNPSLASSVQSAVSWSPDAETYLQVMASVISIEKQVAALGSPLLRTQSSLLQYAPGNMVLYGAVPNMSGTLDEALGLAEQQSAENPAFDQWWNAGAGTELKKLIARIQTVVPLLGDEIVYGICFSQSGPEQTIPMLIAEVKQGKRTELAAALDALGLQASGAYQITDTMMAISNSPANLQWLFEHMGEGADSPFAAEIAARYRDGASWLLGIDMSSVSSRSTTPDIIKAQNVRYLILEQRSSQGNEENEVTVSFDGPRAGIASILASAGSGGAAEYLSADSIFAGYASTREPKQLFDELTAQFSKASPEFQRGLGEAEGKLGISLSNDLARALGTESAFAIEGITTNGPVWTMALLVNDSSTLDSVIQRLVDSANSEFMRSGRPERIAIEKEVVDGRAWKTIKFSYAPFGITWTYDRGYMVAGNDRGAATRAIATRNGGSPLIWSPAFQQQLSPSAGLHPSAFAWLNTKGALSAVASLAPNPALQKLASERDPILVLFSGTMEQIRAVSRTRLTGMVLNFMLLQGFGKASSGSPAAAL